MGLFEKANQLAVLVTGRYPEWRRFFSDLAENATPAGALGTPSTSSAGIYLQDSPKTIVTVDLRQQVHRRMVRIKIANLVTPATYNVIVDGNTVAYAAGGGETNEQVIDGIAAAINADLTVGPIVLATPIDEADDDGTNETTVVERDTVVLTGKTEADYSIDHSATGGAVMTVYADPVACDLKVWVRAGGKTSTVPADSRPISNWRVPNGGVYAGLSNVQGFAERFDTAGLDRMYCEIENVTGFTGDALTTAVTYRARVYIGAAIDEPT